MKKSVDLGSLSNPEVYPGKKIRTVESVAEEFEVGFGSAADVKEMESYEALPEDRGLILSHQIINGNIHPRTES